MKPEIVPATYEHFAELGERVRRGCRAIAAVLDGKTIGITGFYAENGRVVVFSTITPELRQFKKTIVKGARMILEMAMDIKAPINAVAEPETPGSERLLEGLGFVHLDGNVYGRLH